jgi:hypothetical protein
MARRIRLDLLNNAGAGNGASFDWPGGDGVFFVESATFGGGNVALQIQGPNLNWFPVVSCATTTPIEITSPGMANFRAPAGPMRAVSTTATAVFASAVGLPANTAG